MWRDVLFQVWRRFRGPMQWRLLYLTQAKFMVNVAGVIFDPHGRVLLLKHKHWVPDVWGLPGGILERGESLEEGLAREIKEETGLTIKQINLLHIQSGYRLRLESYYSARISDDKVTIKLEPIEIEAAQFFNPNELPAKMLPVHRELIMQAAGK